MARLIPPAMPPGRPNSEQGVYRALSGLGDDWTVLYSVGWQHERHGRPGDGEADFVLLHRRGLLVLEVKGGVVEVAEGVWISTSHSGERHVVRNPFEQALASRKALQAYLFERVPRLRRLHTGHAVVFPDLRVPGDLGPAGPAAIIIDRDGLATIESSIGRLFSHWELASDLSAADIKAIVDVIAPTTRVRPLAREIAEDVNEKLLELTTTQVGTLSMLRRNRRALIFGGAGTGKTVLAVERARQLAADGFEVLLTCFNRPLGDYLQNQFQHHGHITATAFHTLGYDLAKRAGLPVAITPTQDWWDQTMPSLLNSAADKVGFGVDAIVVDEGQDFRSEWWLSLELLLRDPDQGPFYVFADATQQIYRADWRPPFAGPSFDLAINCRNTVSIARRVSAVFGTDPVTLGATGPEPVFVAATEGAKSEAALAASIDRIINQGALASAQLVVLSPSRAQVEGLRGQELAGWGLVGPGEDGILVETVHRFKGLEADAVILVLDRLDPDRDRALAYIGMSRARVFLVVIGPTKLKVALNW